MKSIATINFKGGVGKTTITWLLAKYMAEKMGKKVLVFDTDAQMSLTLAAQLQEDSGSLYGEFKNWYDEQHIGKGKTLLNALEKYDSQSKGFFDFPIDSNFIYKLSEKLYFVPSIVDLYWLELDVFDREKVQFFIRALLGKLEHSTYKFDYVFFDCPPNFTALSYSVLSCTSLVLVPVNPDVFASRGIGMMIDGLKLRIQPWPNPKIAVFMNKAKLYRGNPTRETTMYWNGAKEVCSVKEDSNTKIYALSSMVPERVNIKRAIPKAHFPNEFADDFKNIAQDIITILK